MGIERARVVEVHAQTSATRRAGSGYQISDRLLLTHGGIVGGVGRTDVRPAGTAVWASASVVWRARAGDVAVLEVDEPSVLMWSPAAVRWGLVAGRRPVSVTAMGFPPSADGERPHRARDTHQFVGQLVPDGLPVAAASIPVTAAGSGRPTGDGMSGAALFAGAELVGVLVAEPAPSGGDRLRAVPVSVLADDPDFVGLVGGENGLAMVPVVASSIGFPILQLP
jgi:hypothetical protein